MSVQLPRLLFTEIIATSVSSNPKHSNASNNQQQQQQQQQHSSSTSHVEHYLMVSPEERARHLGYRIRLGSLLWHSSPQSTTAINNNNNKNDDDDDNGMERGEMKEKKGSKLSKEMKNALEQNWVSPDIAMNYEL